LDFDELAVRYEEPGSGCIHLANSDHL